MCFATHLIVNQRKKNQRKRENPMEKSIENKIVRECVQGLIDDSKMIDELCISLETERINLVKVVADLDSNNSSGHITLDMLQGLKSELESASNKADECRSQADYLKDEADECESAINECDYIVDSWTSDMKKIKQEKEDAKQDKEIAEQKEIDTSNQYEQTPINNKE